MSQNLVQHVQKAVDDFNSSKPKSPLRKKSAKTLEDFLTLALFEENVEAVKLIAPFWGRLSLSSDLLLACQAVPAAKTTPASAEIFSLLSECGIIKNPGRWLQKSIMLRNIHLTKSVLPFASQTEADEALCAAATYGLLSFVKEIVKEANPKANKSLALQRAALYNQKDVMDFLFDKSEGSFALRELTKNHVEALEKEGPLHLKSLVQKEKALKQKAKILSKISDLPKSSRRQSKM